MVSSFQEIGFPVIRGNYFFKYGFYLTDQHSEQWVVLIKDQRGDFEFYIKVKDRMKAYEVCEYLSRGVIADLLQEVNKLIGNGG